MNALSSADHSINRGEESRLSQFLRRQFGSVGSVVHGRSLVGRLYCLLNQSDCLPDIPFMERLRIGGVLAGKGYNRGRK